MQLPNIFIGSTALSLQSQVTELLETNNESQKYGLALQPQGALELLTERTLILKNVGRIELDSSLSLKLIHRFCDSAYIQQDAYLSTLIELQELFYELKNETEDRIADDDLLLLLKDFYENHCDGDLEYLRGKYLDALCRDTKRHNQIQDFFLEDGDKNDK